MSKPVAWRQKEDPADMRSAWHFWTRQPPVGAEPLVTAASLADAQAEIARLRGALEKCSTALYLAAPFADGCNVEDALTIEIGRAAALEALKK